MYREYDIESPNQALKCIRDVLVDNDWTILNNCTPDISPCNLGNKNRAFTSFPNILTAIPPNYSDGLILAATKDDVYLVFRSINGINAFDSEDGININTTFAAPKFSDGLFSGMKISDAWNKDNFHQIIGYSADDFLNPALYGIVMTSCTHYTANPSSEKWYDQANVIRNKNDKVIAVGIPIPKTKTKMKFKGEVIDCDWRKIKMIVNYTTDPEISCVLTFRQGYLAKVQKGEIVDMDRYSEYDLQVKYQYLHMAFAKVEKVGTWNGGTIISGSINASRIRNCIDVEFESVTGTNKKEDDDTSFVSDSFGSVYDTIWKTPNDSYYYRKKIDETSGEYEYFSSTNSGGVDQEAVPLFGMTTAEKCATFCRVDIDAAPTRPHQVLWASATSDTDGDKYYTDKTLATPIIDIYHKNFTVPNIPHYMYLQSQSKDDFGRNVNTLNNIALDLPITLFALRDPDRLRNYSQIGYVPNVYATSLRCIAPYKKYKFEYPYDYEHQVFPHCLRGGKHGYDGISIQQEVPLEEDENA